MRLLLVASRGGHLQQLRELSRRFDPRPTEHVWVTDEGAVELIELQEDGAETVGAHTPTRRNVGNMARNLLLARRLMRAMRPDCVVSTGAGIAPPFMLAARLAGIPALYIESATFLTAPSVAARLTAMIPGVELRHQTCSSAFGPRWKPLRSPFDEFDIRERRVRPSVKSVFVSLGTQAYRFDRLVDAVDRIVRSRELLATWQLGHTADRANDISGHAVADMTPREWRSTAASADVVIGHAGTGLVLSSLRLGMVPVICARDPDLGEHVDAHQVDTILQVQDRGCALVATPETLDSDDLHRAASLEAIASDVVPEPIILPV